MAMLVAATFRSSARSSNVMRYHWGLFFLLLASCGCEAVTRQELNSYRERVRSMFTHGYDSYMKYAFPLDELRPLTCDGFETWGSNSLTLIDALDTLVVMGNYSEFRRVAGIVLERTNFNKDLNVSVFETNIRVVGGLISAHLLSKKAGLELEVGWPCQGPLLRLAVDVARRLLPAFDTATGMPYGTVNLKYGVPEGETSVTCTAGVGTFVVEFAALSRLTGDPVFEETAVKALHSLWDTRSAISLVGNHLDVQSNKWTATDASIGAGVDSYFEYLVKGAVILREKWLMKQFEEYRNAINKYMRKDDWFVLVRMQTGEPSMPYYQSLESFWPGVLSLSGYIEDARKSLYNYHQVWKQLGFIPEFYDIPRSAAHDKRESYPLRPEFIESVMYLYQATKDPHFIEIGVDVLTSIEYSAKTECGYATVKNVASHQLENRMESFFLAETTKYLYLLFDVDNFVHNPFQKYDVVNVTNNGHEFECVFDAGGYIFNTEAHIVDVALLDCCMADNVAMDLQVKQAKKSVKTRENLIELFKSIRPRNNSSLSDIVSHCFPEDLTDSEEPFTMSCPSQNVFSQFALRGQMVEAED